jgi:hypothetical protein
MTTRRRRISMYQRPLWERSREGSGTGGAARQWRFRLWSMFQFSEVNRVAGVNPRGGRIEISTDRLFHGAQLEAQALGRGQRQHIFAAEPLRQRRRRGRGRGWW